MTFYYNDKSEPKWLCFLLTSLFVAHRYTCAGEKSGDMYEGIGFAQFLRENM